MEGILLALALLAVPPAPCANPDCYCRVCDCDVCNCGLFAEAPDKPVEIVLVTAESYCVPCQALAPHWSAVSANDPVCRTLDISDADSDDAKEARKLGVSKIPCLVRLVNGRVERTSLVGGLDLEGLRATVERWKR